MLDEFLGDAGVALGLAELSRAALDCDLAPCVLYQREAARPAEDCGGVHAYELIEAATDTGDPDHAGAAMDFDAMFGSEVNVASMAGTAFSIDEINGALLVWGSVGKEAAPGPPGLPVPLRELVTNVRTASERRLLLSRICCPVRTSAGAIGALRPDRGQRCGGPG